MGDNNLHLSGALWGSITIWLLPWDKLDEWTREADRRIGVMVERQVIGTAIVMRGISKVLTPEERAIWGSCEVCQAEHGEPYRLPVGTVGTHIRRLDSAPYEVRLVEVR